MKRRTLFQALIGSAAASDPDWVPPPHGEWIPNARPWLSRDEVRELEDRKDRLEFRVVEPLNITIEGALSQAALLKSINREAQYPRANHQAWAETPTS